MFIIKPQRTQRKDSKDISVISVVKNYGLLKEVKRVFEFEEDLYIRINARAYLRGHVFL